MQGERKWEEKQEYGHEDSVHSAHLGAKHSEGNQDSETNC